MKPILNPITSKAYTRLIKKLSYLKNIVRKRAVEEIVKAKNHGDLSENAEYNAAKENFSLVKKDINDLPQVLSKINVVSENEYSSGYLKKKFFLVKLSFSV